jgi:site-specific DNA-methyltransferase (adenine-specific)
MSTETLAAPAAADSAFRTPQAAPALDAIHQGDCVELLGRLADGSVDLAFADPPFNIGFHYDEYHDQHDDDTYLSWCEAWMGELHRVLRPSGAFWLAIGDEYAAELKVAAKGLGFTARNWVVWYYTFGQNCRRKFNRSHAHLFHFVKDEELHTFHAEDPAVRVPSARALVYGDSRANPTGRLPDDTWILRPQDLRESPEAFQSMDDTWYFSRVAGTFKERQGFHGCQMPEQLLARIVRVSSSPGDVVLDPFAGSGTTLAVAKKLGRRYLGFELSKDYAKYGSERVASAQVGDELSGPADPVASSPTTAAGRKLAGHPMVEAAGGGQPAAGRRKLRQNAVEAVVPEPSAQAVGVAPQATQPERASGEPAAKAVGENTVAGTGKALGGLTVVGGVTPTALAAGSPKQLSLRELSRGAIVEAFAAVSGGQSVDWLLCDAALRRSFAAACEAAGLMGSPSDWITELLRLRKAGKLSKSTTATREAKRADIDSAELDRVAFAAEIAWAEAERRHPGVTLDALLANDELAGDFDRAAAKRLEPARGAAAEARAALVRWGALKLRKARHALAAEAHQYHYVLKTRDFDGFTPLSRTRVDRWDGVAGVYLLRDKKRQAIYVGESLDLGRRLTTHKQARGNELAGAQLAVITADQLPAADYRAPLWLDLVHRHRPKLNAQLDRPGDGEAGA